MDEEFSIPIPGEGLSDGDVPFFRVSFSPIFSTTGYQKKANFLEQVVKTYQKRKFCYNGLLFGQIFVFLSILFTDFFWNRVSFKGKTSGAGCKNSFPWEHPHTNLGQVPPPGIPYKPLTCIFFLVCRS